MSKQSSARHAHLSELHIRISGDCGDQDVNEIQAEVQALFRRTLRGSLHLHKLLVSRSSITPWLGPILDDELTSVKTLIIHTTCHHDLESLPTLPRSQVTNISFRYHAPTIESESFPRFKTCLETHKDTVQYLHVAADIDTFPSKDVVFPCLRYLNLGILHARVPLEVLTKSCPNITHLTIRMTPHDLNARLEENLRIQDDPSCRWTQLGKLTSDIATLAGMGLVSQVNHVVVMGVLTRKKHFTWLYYVIKDNCPKSLSISLSSDPGDISLEPEVLGSFPHLKSLAVTVNVGQPYGTLLQFRISSLLRLLRKLAIMYFELRLEAFKDPADSWAEELLRPIRDLNVLELVEKFLRNTPSLTYVFFHLQGQETCWRASKRDGDGKGVVVTQVPPRSGRKVKTRARLHAIPASDNYHWP